MIECRICKLLKDTEEYHNDKRKPLGKDNRCKECRKKLAKESRINNYFSEYLRTKRSECKRKGLEFNLTVEFIESIWTGICPIFNINITFNQSNGNKNPLTHAHLDRIDPNKGYIIGNVSWISGRANRIKYNASIEELESILKYLKSYNV